jgi:hypothetical protein
MPRHFHSELTELLTYIAAIEKIILKQVEWSRSTHIGEAEMRKDGNEHRDAF